jgi:hypothetical protein
MGKEKDRDASKEIHPNERVVAHIGSTVTDKKSKRMRRSANDLLRHLARKHNDESLADYINADVHREVTQHVSLKLHVSENVPANKRAELEKVIADMHNLLKDRFIEQMRQDNGKKHK